eukprot:1941373-Ditylum_brightwellii.AAC.1
MPLHNVTCHELIHHIVQLRSRPTMAIIVASDNSASEQKNTMPFGWVMSLLGATTLATHSDPMFGQVSLFQAEGYRLLLVSHFLHPLQKYMQLTPAFKV